MFAVDAVVARLVCPSCGQVLIDFYLLDVLQLKMTSPMRNHFKRVSMNKCLIDLSKTSHFKIGHFALVKALYFCNIR